jgi:c(7)-type cytochrome triheme protein
MRLALILVAVLLVVGAMRFAQAVPPGLVLEFEGSRQGKVIFQGDVHSGTGMYCADCHMAIFDVSRASQITRRDHNEEVFCFTCHNGETAFAARRNCANCHVEEAEQP